MKVRVSAPGKVILSGEHSVVYGYPALVTSITLRANVTLDNKVSGLFVNPSFARQLVSEGLNKIDGILGVKFNNLKVNIDSEIPIGCGVGSSAAVAAALSGAVLHLKRLPFNLKRINELAYEIEKINHGNPSGVDNSVSTFGGFLWYRKEAEKLKILNKVNPLKMIPNIVFVNTGKPKETTGEMVSFVSEKYIRNKRIVERIFLNIEKVTRGFLKYLLKEETIEFSDLIKENERYLEELGVVSISVKDLIGKIEKIGGAAKISGAGGLKVNSGILMIYHPDKFKFLKFAKEKRLDILPAKFSAKGVKIERK